MIAIRVLLVIGALVGTACAASAPPQPAPGSTTESLGTGESPAPPRTLIPMQTSYSAISMSMVPIAIAREAGYFQEQGLDVGAMFINASAQNAAALLSGEVDVSALGGIGPIRARLGGTDLLLIGATKPYFSGSLIARPQIGITGKGGNTDLMMRVVLPRLGLEPDRDVMLFDTGNNPETLAALTTGNIAAAALTPPGDERARGLGFPTLVDVTAARILYPALTLGTAGSTLAKRADVLERFLRGYGQAVHRYRTDKSFALAVALDFLRTDDPAANEQAYEVERSLMPPDLDLPLAAIQATLDLLKLDDPRAAEANAADFVDLRLLHGLQQSGFFERLATEQPAR
jgi:ABC-type nitrate/sulfonate/bicarbonate transport system substrate-binding protein